MNHRKKQICVAKIISVHGIKGAVKIRSFTEETMSFNNYGDLSDAEDNVIKIQTVSSKGDIVIAHIENVIDRDVAEKFIGTNLFIDRSVLPLPKDDEFYIEDLVGMDVFCSNNKKCGVVKYLHNFGSGDIIEICFDGNNYKMLAFTKENFPEINFQNNFIKTSLF
jgi:16S rRNA processing protein RimM